MNILDAAVSASTLQLSIRVFVDREVIPCEREIPARDVVRLDQVTTALRRKASAAGLIAAKLWQSPAGDKVSWQRRHPVLEEVGRSPLGPAALHCAPPDLPNIDLLDELATPDQRTRFLEPLQQALVRSCFAMTEPAPGAGSDPGMLRTTARRDGDSWVLDGNKWFISGAVGAAFAIVIAKTDQGPTLFLVETNNPGWRLVRNLPSLDGYQLGGHGEIQLDDCVVSDRDRLGEIGRALEYAQRRLEPARLAHCMRMIGRAQRVMEVAQDYVNQRRSFNSELASLQSIQTLVADSHIDLHAARLMTADVAARLDNGEPVKQESAMAKVFVSEAVCRVADRAVQLAGARGTLLDEVIAQFFTESRPFRIYDGASEVHRVAIGRRLLKSRQRLSASAMAAAL